MTADDPATLSWARLETVPRADDAASAAAARGRIWAALTSSHAELLDAGGEDSVVAFCCLRSADSPRLTFLIGASPGLPPGLGRSYVPGGAAVTMAYPPGATAVPLPGPDAARALAAPTHWVRCGLASDVLLHAGYEPSEPGAAPGHVSRPSFDEALGWVDDAFAWLVWAQPLPAAAVEHELSRMSARIPLLRQRANAEHSRLELLRAEARFRELETTRHAGVWQVRVLVGGSDAPRARRVAALLAGTAELAGSSYAVVPGAGAPSLAECLDAVDDVHPDAHHPEVRYPGIATSQFLATVARPPGQEMPGLRATTPARFDVAPVPGRGGPAVVLGQVLDETGRAVGGLAVDDATLNRHTFICGATGSGKSQTARHLLEGLTRRADPVPWLVIEPAKAEYARVAGRLGGKASVLVIRPGELDVPPGSVNPLEPEPGFPLQSHVDLLRALFVAAFDADEPFPQVLSHSLTRCYADGGWNLVTGRPAPAGRPTTRRQDPGSVPPYPTLGDLQTTARAVVRDIGYGPEMTADVKGFIDVRLGSLRLGAPGRFFEGGHPLDVAALLRRNVVLELEAITNDQDKAFVMGTVLIRLVEHLRVHAGNAPPPGLRHVVLVEEAHRLLRATGRGTAAAAVELFADMLAEIRAYGEGVVVVEQIPSKIVPDVVKNTALKVMHRLPAADDRFSVGTTMNMLPEQSMAVVALEVGTAAVGIAGEDRPLLVRVPLGEDRETRAGETRLPPFSGPRSALCPPGCGETPCTLRGLAASADIAGAAPVVVWIETVAASMVVGVEAPQPARSAAAALGQASRLRDCAVAQAVDRAVAARRVLLTAWVDPQDFATRLGVVADARLRGVAVPGGDERDWQAGYYRYQRERALLRRAVEQAADAETGAPHPQTAAWASHGLLLEAPTLLGQLHELERHPAFSPAQRAVALGDADRSGLRAAVRSLAGEVSPSAVERVLPHCVRGSAVVHLIPVVAELIGGR